MDYRTALKLALEVGFAGPLCVEQYGGDGLSVMARNRDTLRHLGFKSTLHYLEAMCELVLRETTLLPHPNPGLMSAEWIARLSAVSPSMGLMLETTSDVLLGTACALLPGAAHARSVSGSLPWSPVAGAPPAPVRPGPWVFFTPEEGAAMEAVVDRLTRRNQAAT